VVTASSKNTLYKEGYYCENKNWIVEYDPNFHYLIEEVITEEETKLIYTRGRITKLTDKYGNSGNYDFKHRLFKFTSEDDDRKTWFYTFNKVRPEPTTNPEEMLLWEFIHSNYDATEEGEIMNNIVSLPGPEFEEYVLSSGETVLKVK
jgi:hypothetical protein